MEQKPLDRLRCVVERITYQSDGYSVLKCAAKGYSDLVAVVGMMPDAHVGSVLTLGGHWKIDSKYGRQFEVVTFEETLPATVYGIEKYLGSGLIKGIGPKFAKLIVNQFGKDTLNVIEESPDDLLAVPNIGRKRVDNIKKGWAEQKEIKNIMLFLQGHDVSTAHATRIYKAYQSDAIKVVTENPYRLADDIWGIGFKTADTIAAKLGMEKEKYVRLRAGLMYTLNKLSEDGHCYGTRDQLLETGSKLLDVEDNLLSMTLDEMIRTEDVCTTAIPASPTAAGGEENGDARAIYLPPFFFSEVGVAKRLKQIYAASASKPAAEQLSITPDIEYDEVQLKAIETAVTSKVMVLTGGPGTGKSTTTLGIIRAFAGQTILLAAPTGRAAKRLSEVTQMEAKTIHRLLEFKPPEGYKRDEKNPLEGDVLIIDEASMIDVILMYNLLKAVPDGMRLIFVGDVDQLPSVGAGNVLRDVIDSQAFPVIRLERIFRQAASSRIITNAHKINEGQFPDLSNSKGTDFFFQAVEAPEKAVDVIRDLVSKRLPRYYKVAPTDIQVLTPMQRGVVGAANLNQVLQGTVNPSTTDRWGGVTPELHRGGYTYRPNDKVMQIRNNYEKEVFNGDIGTIQSINVDDRTLIIRFDERSVEYDVTELDEIVLAYATTVHKAQGAEYPIVVMPVMMTHFAMLQRNLLYTGVTRAKKVLMLVGTKKAIAYCCKHVTVDKRNTLLAWRLNPLLAPPSLSTSEPSVGEVAGEASAPAVAEKGGRYIVFDVETPNHFNDRMSAIGISVVEGNQIIDEFFSYVNPEEPFDDFNTDLTGISAATVADAPSFPELWATIAPLFSSGILVAHNAQFDLTVLRKCLSAYGIKWKAEVEYTCTVQIGRRILPRQSHKLNEMCDYYGISLDHHQADSDSHAAAEILLRYMRDGVDVGKYIKTWRL